MRVKIVVRYDGAGFNGWQFQPNLRTVQGELERAVFEMTGECSSVQGSGRTDAGVHAFAQVAHFDLSRDFDLKKLPHAMNFYLNKEDIRVVSAESVTADFHARISAKSKSYVYKMYDDEFDNPIFNNRAFRVEGFDLAIGQAAAQLFCGVHDFSGFMSAGSAVKTTTREVYYTRISSSGGIIDFEICANGFLYNMVRKITAAIVLCATNRQPLSFISQNLNSPAAPIQENLPPYALYLKQVNY